MAIMLTDIEGSTAMTEPARGPAGAGRLPHPQFNRPRANRRSSKFRGQEPGRWLRVGLLRCQESP